MGNARKMVNGAGLEPATTGLKVRPQTVASDCGTVSCADGGNPLAPVLAHDSGRTVTEDPKQAAIDALRGLDRDTLLAVLAEMLMEGKA